MKILSLSSLFILLYLLFTFKKRASPGIEPGPPAPKAGILPLNYKAFLLLCSYVCCSDRHTDISQLYLLLKKGALAGIEPAPPAP